MNVAFDFKFGPLGIPQKFVLHSTKFLYAILVPNPILKGHVIVCTKRDVSRYADLYNEEIFDLSLTIQYLSTTLENFYKLSSSTISIQDGEGAGQSIYHFHAHIIPRYKGDFKNSDEIYPRIKTFDEELVKGFTELQMNLKSQIEYKEEIDRLKEFMLKSFYLK